MIASYEVPRELSLQKHRLDVDGDESSRVFKCCSRVGSHDAS